MASILKKCTIQNVITRSLAAQAAAALKPQVPNAVSHEPHSSIENDIVVSSIDDSSPVASIAFLYKSGPRYENFENLGVSYGVRAFAAHATAQSSTFLLGRTFQQGGNHIVCESGREHILYGFSSLKDFMYENFKELSHCAIQHDYKHWEVKRDSARLQYETEVLDDPTIIVLEMLHRAAYRKHGLGNSILMPEHRHGSYSTTELTQFMQDTHTKGRMAVVGLGIEHSELVKMVISMCPNEGSGYDVGMDACKYEGGLDVRHETREPLAYVTVAGAGAKIGSQEAASFSVAAEILKCNPGVINLPLGIDGINKFSSAISSVGGTGIAVPININYSDAGLFGFMLVEHPEKAGEATRALVDCIKNLKVSEMDVKQAITRMKSQILIRFEDRCSLFNDMGMQSLYLRNYTCPMKFTHLNTVTAASVQSALASMLKSKPSLAAYGAIRNVPYLDQL